MRFFVVVVDCDTSKYLISSHHFHEFIEINSSWSVSINFLNDAIQISACQFVVKSGQDFLEGGGGDVTVSFTIVKTESFFQFSAMKNIIENSINLG